MSVGSAKSPKGDRRGSESPRQERKTISGSGKEEESDGEKRSGSCSPVAASKENVDTDSSYD